MALKPFEVVEFGGVDSRSNPVNMPRNRALRCLNWVPKQDGHIELRYGYSTESMDAVSATAIHSMFPYQSWDGTKKYILYAQGTTVKVHDLSTQTESTPAVRGAAIASSSKWNGYFAFNRQHFGNGTDQKFFDGTTIRDNGLRAPTAAEFASAVVTEGVRELTTAENSTISLAQGASGSFNPTTYSGYAISVALFDVSGQELGPATLLASGSRIKITSASQKITVSNMPNLSGVNTNWVKLISRTDDGTEGSYFCTTTSTSITSCTRASLTLTVISTSHGLSTNDIVIMSGTTNFDGVYVITVVDANTFTILLNQGSGNNVTGGNTTGGTVKHILSVGNAVTTVDIVSTARDLSFIVNQNRGVAASTVGGANPGYQFYGAIYNPTTGHVGNRLIFGPRVAPATRCNVRIFFLPSYAGIDTEWGVLIGRTGDGAAVPYAVEDNDGNLIATASGQTAITIWAPVADANFELPTRNGVIPSQCTMFAHVGDYIYAADPTSPTVRRSGSAQDFNIGQFLGRPEQSWAGNDIETFPTGEAVRGIAEEDQELFVGTLNDCAVLSDQNGIPMWKGPWNVGLAGPRAMVKAKPYGFFWLSGSKQLCTFVNGMPTPVSDEYEIAELSQIGDSNLSAVELTYYRDASIGKDELRVEGQKQDGTPITIIHDFKLRDERSPFGQGYSAQFMGPLAVSFTSVMARDANGKRRIYAGDAQGQLYLLYNGANDASQEYSADGIFLIDVGPNRPSIPWIAWIGDQYLKLYIGKTLSTSLAAGAEWTFDLLSPTAGLPQNMPGAESDPTWRVDLDAPQMQTHLYIRLVLASHSTDGSLALNSPVHVPLETYGRVYEIIPAAEAERGR